MSGFSFRRLSFMLCIAFLVWCSSLDACMARRGKHWRQNRATSASLYKKKGKSHGSSHHNHNGGSKPKTKPKIPSHKAPLPPPPSPPPKEDAPPSSSPTKGSATFNVLDFGAKGDGKSDDTKLDGTMVAPTNSNIWGKGLLWWIEFTKLKGITVQGTGTIDGSGSVWWQDYPFDDPLDDETKLIIPLNNTVEEHPPIPIRNEFSKKMPSIKPTALRFYGSFNATVSGITIQNSPQCHLKFDNCMGVVVHDISISSPGDSPNTDGIHLQNTKDVLVHSSNLACGDDCISIQTGCSNVYVHNVNCGPGHGISIGSLGKDNTKACVSNITVRDVMMHNTMTGVRIKTWQGGSGSVQGVLFSNIQVSEVQLPIVIDQFYCDKRTCKNQTSAVALSGINYEKIRGTYTVKPVHFACSDALPCLDVSLTTIELKPLQEHYHMYDPFCWQTFGELNTPTTPPIDCLQIGKPSSNRPQSDHDAC
uniref:Polygalacturonase n=1 Tax=Manihot esculenta TaxID=3983 RepID=A0A2C9UST4_MANES